VTRATPKTNRNHLATTGWRIWQMGSSIRQLSNSQNQGRLADPADLAGQINSQRFSPSALFFVSLCLRAFVVKERHALNTTSPPSAKRPLLSREAVIRPSSIAHRHLFLTIPLRSV